MRRFILIAAMLLASASAQAGPLRGLSLASSDDPAIVDQSRDQTKTVTGPQPTIVSQADTTSQTGFAAEPTAAPAPQAETPKYVERPAAVSPATTATTSDAPMAATKIETSRPAAVKSDAAGSHALKTAGDEKTKAQRARRRNDMTVARLIHELHRYGIYW